MSKWIAMRIMDAKDKGGVEAAQEKYAAYFLVSDKAQRYQAETDVILIKNGYEDCIVQSDIE